MNLWHSAVASLTTESLRVALEWLGAALVHFLWQGAVVALLAAVTLAALRRHRPTTRYGAACAALALLALCPLLTLIWTYEPAAWSRAVTSSDAAGAGGRNMLVAASPQDDAGSRSARLTEPRRTAESVDSIERMESGAAIGERGRAADDWLVERRAERSAEGGWRSGLQVALPWIAVAWGIGVGLLAARLCGGWWWLWRRQRASSGPAPDEWQTSLRRLAERLGVTSPVLLLAGEAGDSPAAYGWWRPVIWLPVSLTTGLSTCELEAILAHELAHVRRHDYAINLIQTAIETALFYHPVVWWLGRVIREERELCCDEMAVEACGDRVRYVRTLARLEELRAAPALTLAANGGSLARRVRRLLGQPASAGERGAWWPLAAGMLGLLLGLVALASAPEPATAENLAGAGTTALPVAASKSTAEPTDATNAALAGSSLVGAASRVPTAPAIPVASEPAAWGPEANGLRCRLVAVPTTADDERPDPSVTTREYAKGDDICFAVELKNVSEKPIKLLGVRYGDSFPTAVGKLNSRLYATFLFDVDFFNASGKPLALSGRRHTDSFIVLSGIAAHEVAPGETLVVQLRPAQFLPPFDVHLPRGSYSAVVRYRGVSEEARTKLKKHWPDKPQGDAWSGAANSLPVKFEVREPQKIEPQTPLVWGPEMNGLKAAVEFIKPAVVAGTPQAAPGVPVKTKLGVIYHVRNVSEATIQFVSESARQSDSVVIKDAEGREQALRQTFFSGMPLLVRLTLEPGQTAQLHALAPGLETLEKPGAYSVTYRLRLDGIQQQDESGRVIIPAEGDARGELETGATPLVLRARTPEDDVREAPPSHASGIEFRNEQGERVGGGVVTVRSNTGEPRADWRDLPLLNGACDLARCTDDSHIVFVRAAGYEQAVFYDVKFKSGVPTRFTLKQAAPTRLRIVSQSDGKPIANARVRFFNKTSGLAAAGPFPTDGIEGPVWATSSETGQVTLDSLQKTDPYYAKLGDAIYHFYVEAEGWAPTFVGPVKAGQDVGDVRLGRPFEVSGEIQGTPEQLEQFAAEWDQPAKMASDNPEATWLYAVSQPLEVTRDGDKLRFKLSGLRPGPLRIVANFGPRPHQVSHTYGRRDPKGSDEVIEFELREARHDLRIVAKKKAAP